ncbi:flagellar basal body-associated FliL family protein [Rhizobacter sp. J219]|jgi:flagellar FliL protein|uniref:flagellar basal body-associated FliL family protein n=1 Tax=Rhizobacter sp. J219 TaxID=2898430 RepID=UPI0021509C6D|nr:flagellar basal body-associated FliL family protein [Rhizobacter sp. J219]MCR5885982.1 flagellar basal body-associated FliL family protein [Rhizobacter sp. J219]
MSKAAAATVEAVAGDAPPPKGKKKLIIILAAVLVLALAGGGAAVFMMKKKAAAEAEEDDGGAAAAEAKRKEHAAKHPPVFVPLEPFVVNLADKESDRYAQIGVTLEVEDPKFAEEMKAYMPAIRNGILMVLSHKTSAQLLSREGKVALAKDIMREAVLPLGIEIKDEPAGAPVVVEEEEEEDEDAPKKKKKASAGPVNPVKRVHFSNFIVQ